MKPNNLSLTLLGRFGTGIEFRESGLVIGPKSDARVANGQVYNVSIGFQDLSNKEAQDGKAKKYSLFIGDTVVVEEVSDVQHCCMETCWYSFHGMWTLLCVYFIVVQCQSMC